MEHELINKAQSGDQEAYGQLVKTHARNMFKLAFRMIGNEQDAEDVVQEALIKAHRNLTRFKGESGFGTWLHRITANTALDMLRRQKRSVEDAQPEHFEYEDRGQASPEHRAYGEQIQKQIYEQMADLSDSERMAFVLRHMEDRPIAEIAGLMGIKPNAAKHAIFRAVGKLRKSLEPLGRYA